MAMLWCVLASLALLTNRVATYSHRFSISSGNAYGMRRGVITSACPGPESMPKQEVALLVELVEGDVVTISRPVCWPFGL